MSYYFVYVVFSGVLLLIITKGNWSEWRFKMCVVTFIPVIGWLTPSIWPKKWIKKDELFLSTYLADQSSDIRIELLASQSKVLRDQELNIISIEEALIVNDYSTRRKILIDMLKEDDPQFIDVLKIAVLNEDSETSHYAVTAVIEMKRKLTNLMQKFAAEYSKHPQNIEVAKAYKAVIKEYLRSGFLDYQSTKKYQFMYIELLQRLIESKQASEENYIEKIHLELAIKDTVAAEKTVILYKERFPLSEQAYICAMKIYFEEYAINKLKQELLLLKSAPITLSKEALNYVRYWSGEIT
ncbi:hypothetical protein [Solibacillus isronensis]|uniref:hypothetical protein n=1 Tax=Solibacillus isronensis TaxID=412383 RepID=UPI0009A68857|nr:hypothetical protein [Solibacillus isronensis]